MGPEQVEKRLSDQLSRLFVASTVAIAILAALLVWQLEHVYSLPITLLIVASGVVVCALVFRRTHAALEALTTHFDTLLQTADEQSRRAESANRLKDEFLATLSHELRTPLNAVLGWARLLDSGKLTPEQATRAVQGIERAGWAQARIIEDLLDISQIVGGRAQLAPRTTAIPPVIAHVVDSLTAAATAKQVRLDTVVEADLEPVTVDPDRIRQILWHLLANAIKFTPPSGRVRVGAARDEKQLRLWVEDTGIGFDPEIANHLFDRFRQADSSTTRAYGGLGLGLGMVRHLAELHGGNVKATSAGPGRGSRFEVTLPVRGGELPGVSAVAPQPAARSLRGITVLTVDDDPYALEFTRTTLERCGATVLTAASATQALEFLEHTRVDVLLSDLRMPDDDGLELIRRVRSARHAEGGQIPAAAVTALARADDRQRALDAGFQAHVVKPVDPQELASTVAWLSQSHGAPSAPPENRQAAH